MTNPANRLSIVDNGTIQIVLQRPSIYNWTCSLTGGSLSFPQYAFVTASEFGADKNTTSLPSQEISCQGATIEGQYTISWSPVNGAKSYRVWKGTVAGTPSRYFNVTDRNITITSNTGAIILDYPPSAGASSVKISNNESSYIIGYNFGINNSEPSSTLSVVGNANITGNLLLGGGITIV